MKKSIIRVPTSRLEALSDGIYAIAMTLIILEVAAPVSGSIHSASALNSYLLGIFPELILYFISFLILASFWYIGHMMYLIERADTRTIYLNMILLMFVVLVPFSTSLMSSCWDYSVAVIFFGVNILVIEIMYYILFYNAYKNGLLSDKLYKIINKHKDIIIIYNYKLRGKLLYPLLLPVCSIIAAIIHPVLGIAIYVILPLFNKFFLDNTLSEEQDEKIQERINDIKKEKSFNETKNQD